MLLKGQNPHKPPKTGGKLSKKSRKTLKNSRRSCKNSRFWLKNYLQLDDSLCLRSVLKKKPAIKISMCAWMTCITYAIYRSCITFAIDRSFRKTWAWLLDLFGKNFLDQVESLPSFCLWHHKKSSMFKFFSTRTLCTLCNTSIPFLQWAGTGVYLSTNMEGSILDISFNLWKNEYGILEVYPSPRHKRQAQLIKTRFYLT